MIKVTTESGSVYMLNPDKKTWSRVRGPEASIIRTDDGTYDELSVIEIGKSMSLICPAITEGAAGRLIFTTLVVSINATA